MPRYSNKKESFLTILTLAFEPVKRAAELASDADRAALAFAVEAVRYAKQWTADTTDMSRKGCATNTALFLDRARACPDSNVKRAFIAYARALRLFESCDYADSIA